MNRNQRRYVRTPKRNDSDGRLRAQRNRNVTEVEEVMPPRLRRDFRDKPMLNRCCFISPDQRSVGQLTEPDLDQTLDQYQNLLRDEDEFGLYSTNTIAQLRELKKTMCVCHKVEIGSQYTKPIEAYLETSNGQWQYIDNAEEIDRHIMRGRDEETITKYHNLPTNIHISNKPRVKIIAEKYTKYKQNNIELRKLEEKVVCVEYDVYDQSQIELAAPVQVMRAFFSIKPIGDKNDNMLRELPSTVRNKFNISSHDLQKLNQHELEIIDGKILENQPYLEDLRKILGRKQISNKKPNHSLDLQTLYEMANREYLNINMDNANYLSKDELSDMQKLILENTKSSAHGISRRTLKVIDQSLKRKKSIGAISQTLLCELLRED